MFFDEPRTPEEIQAQKESAEKWKLNNKLAMGMLKQIRRLIDTHSDEEVELGLCGEGLFGSPELLLRSDGITYKLSVNVNNED